ncbi:unnamed protein product, partial [Effrenium voratum]
LAEVYLKKAGKDKAAFRLLVKTMLPALMKFQKIVGPTPEDVLPLWRALKETAPEVGDLVPALGEAVGRLEKALEQSSRDFAVEMVKSLGMPKASAKICKMFEGVAPKEVTTLVTTLALVAEGASDKNLGSDASASALGQALPVAIKLRSLNKEFLASLAEVAPSEQGKLEILEGFAKSFETAMSQYLKKACEQLKDTKR